MYNFLLDFTIRSRIRSSTILAAPTPGCFLEWLRLLVFFLRQLRLQGVKNTRLRLPSPALINPCVKYFSRRIALAPSLSIQIEIDPANPSDLPQIT